MASSRSLPEVITDVLTHEGAILEKREEGSLEFLLPASLSQTLGIPEQGILAFSSHASGQGTITVSYESEFFRTVEKIFSGRGKMAKAAYPFHSPNIDKLSKWALERVAFGNATFRLKEVDRQVIGYALIFFKYVALSDEKREGVFSLLVNKRNLSTMFLGDNLAGLLVNLKDSDQVIGATGPEKLKVIRAALSAASFIVREEFGPFIKSLEKRLNRDTARVFHYYETLKFETQRVFEKKGFSGKDDNAGMTAPEEGEKTLSRKMEAIETEKRWKIQDLISKYALEVGIEPISLIDIETQTPVFWIEIKRRLSSRVFPVTYNPFFRKMDPLPCEACFYPRGGNFVCDEQLHIVCSACFLKCPTCGRQYCRACTKAGCPRCSQNSSEG